MQEVFDETIRLSTSPTQKIFNSHIFSRWFEEAVLEQAESPQVTSLSAAKHRFASYAKPMSRILLHLKIFFRLLHRIAAMRDDADWARTWLANISCHKLLLLALAADGADSLMQLCRFLDTESTDPAALNQEIGHFLEELHVLFRLRKAWEVEGYAKHVLEILKSGSLYALSAGQGRLLALQPGAQDKALKEFLPWLQLCEATVRAEFPHFEVFNSMMVFNLHDNGTNAPATTSQTSQCLRRIALALDLDPSGLKHEWEAVRPIALAQKLASQMDNRDAWKSAFGHTQKTSALKKKYNLENLPKALQAYTCWTPSSCLGYKCFLLMFIHCSKNL